MRHPDIAELLREAMMLQVRVEERALIPDLCGFYWDENRTIMLNDCLSEWQYRCTLCHELVHAKHRDSGCGLVGAKGERRARKETALRLVDPIEYASAEAAYDGDMFLIASELGVTVQVINDYRMWLDNNVRGLTRGRTDEDWNTRSRYRGRDWGFDDGAEPVRLRHAEGGA